MFFRFIKTFERMVLFYGRQLNGTMKETAIKIVLFLRISCYTANRELAVRGRYSGKAKRDSRTGYPAL